MITLAGMFTMSFTWSPLQQNLFVLNTLNSIDGDEFPLQLFVDLFNITPSNSEPNTESAHHIPDWLNSMMFSFASHCNEATFNIGWESVFEIGQASSVSAWPLTPLTGLLSTHQCSVQLFSL